MALFESLLMILCFWPPFASNVPLLRHFPSHSITKLLKKSVIGTTSVICPLLWHIGKVRPLHWHYLHHYGWFCVFIPFCANFSPLATYYQGQDSQNWLETLLFVLYLLAVHFYDILGTLELFNGIICIIIGDFVFLTHFASILPLLRTILRPRIRNIY